MDRSDCPCKADTPETLRCPLMEPTTQEAAVFKHFAGTLIFESTVVGRVAKKIFRILNESMKYQTYISQRDPNVNPIYHTFDLQLPKNTIKSGEYLECIVRYSPQVAFEKNVDYFQVIDNNLKLYRICVQGECIGPIVNLSIKTLYFYNTKNDQQLTNTFEIHNTSNVPATFQFDNNEEDENQEIFKLDKKRGTLGPFQHTYHTIQFSATNNGIYGQQLVCMIMNHPPIIIELVGAQSAHLDFNLPDATLKRYPQTSSETKGYSGFMYDSIKATTKKPPFSLSVTHLDFGGVEFKENANNSRTLVTSLTNHLRKEIEVVWENNNETIFSITPKEIILPAGESILYECQFRPHLADQLYSKLLTACVYWTNFRRTMKEVAFVEIIDVPLNATLKVLGHSFPKNKQWLPRVEICPDVIVLPPCIPMLSSYTTFMLKSSGHLPTLFKFISPKHSNFIVKPKLGIIHEFQIVIAQVQPDSEAKKPYVERWGLELNGRTENCLPFYLKSFSEYPSITVGLNNIVSFKPVHPGCEDISNVMVKNSSVHFLEYKFILDENSNFSIDYPQGLLASNEMLLLCWRFTGHLKAPEVTVIQCEIRTVQNIKMITGTPLHSPVIVYTKCIHSELCATPNGHDFGEIRWGTMLNTSFYLFNFGESPIHFKLVSTEPTDDMEQFTIVPSQGTVNPTEKFRILIHIKATKNEQRQINIMYQIRLNEQSNIVINNGDGKNVFYVQYFCVYPILQIENISGHNFGFLFSKLILWDMFKIDQINRTLREIQHDETKAIEIFLPDYEMGDADYFAILIIENITRFGTEIKLKREKLCDCKLITKGKGISTRAKVYNCIHRDMLKISLSDEFIEVKRPQKMRMEVKYLERGLTTMMYVISLSDNRKINLYVNINVLPEIVTVASTYTQSYEFKLKSVFIGEKEPPAQVFPLYNNSEFTVDYELDIAPLDCINFDYDFEIFKCLNPTGSVLPFTTKYILFRFVPIEVRSYNVSIPFKMGENQFSMEVSGGGTLTYGSPISDMINLVPPSSKGQHIENPVELSTDRLIIETLPVWSTTEKMVFIRNQTADRIIGYSWQTCIIEGTVQANAVHRKGVLEPKESHAVIVCINSFDQPCRLRIQMTCKLLDHTQHIRHKESVVAYERKNRELEGQFTITEDGIFYPKNDVVILPNSEPFFETLTISVCIASIPDKDLYMDRETQMKHSPQYSLHVNMGDIFKNYFKDLIPKRSQLRLQTLKEMDKTEDQRNFKTQKQCCKVRLHKDIVSLFKKVVECLIADTVLSELFCKVVELTNNSFQPYYLQFNMDDKQDQQPVFEDVKERTQRRLQKHMELVDDFLNKPQTPFLAHVFKELIADGIHEVYQLGPQIKHRPHTPYICYSTKSKFTCPLCKCNV